MSPVDWGPLLDRLAARGWIARVVAAELVDDSQQRVAGVLASGKLPGPITTRLAESLTLSRPAEVRPIRSVIVAAAPRPLTRAALTVSGAPRDVVIPPHYAGYYTLPEELAAMLREELEPFGCTAARVGLALKTLAACSGLARYGRNNVAYVPGLGSYLLLAACATDAPPPPETAADSWGDPRQLDRCERCSACLRACPSGAIRADRFLLQTDRCLTWVNEDEAPFPDWVNPAWHHCAVGCLRCQQVCPENAHVELQEDPPESFDERETAGILAATPTEHFDSGTREKLARCGLDYSPTLIARNLHALLGV